MSVYEVARFCRDCLTDLEVRVLAAENPSAVLMEYDITDDERALLLHGDVAGLYEAGHVEFVLSYLPRWGIFGLDVPTYSDRMRRAQVRSS